MKDLTEVKDKTKKSLIEVKGDDDKKKIVEEEDKKKKSDKVSHG